MIDEMLAAARRATRPPVVLLRSADRLTSDQQDALALSGGYAALCGFADRIRGVLTSGRLKGGQNGGFGFR
jgi:hypothetical protein